MLNFDEIAGEAVDEVFGFRGRGRPAVRAARAVHRARVRRRESNRAGWGSPSWQASQGGYDPYSSGISEPEYEEPSDDFYEEDGDGDDEGEEYGFVESEIDEILDEDDEDDEDDEEFGRRGHPIRRAIRRTIKRKLKNRHHRRKERREGEEPPAPSSYAPPYAPPTMLPMYQRPLIPPSGPDKDSYMPYSPDGSVFGYLPEPSRDTVFMDSLKMGLGVGIGLTVVAVGASLISKTLR